MHCVRTFLAALILGAISIVAQAQPILLYVNTLADSASPCSDTCSLRGALASIADGGTIAFDPGITPGTILLQYGALQMGSKSVGIAGPGPDLLAIDAAQVDRVFTIAAPVDPAQPKLFAISGLSLMNGRVGAGTGNSGGAGTGDAGNDGLPASGGCVGLVGAAQLKLIRITLRNCTAQGGNGGAGGTGVSNPSGYGGTGGHGGKGGNALGGAISATVQATLFLAKTSIVDAQAIGGAGGKGGDGGSGSSRESRGAGGAGGTGGLGVGGAIYLDMPASFHGMNVTIGQSVAQGGKGGNGGSGNSSDAFRPGGSGGGGGDARGGLFAAYTGALPENSIYFAFATLGKGAVTPGLHGSGGSGMTPGPAGNDGTGLDAALVFSGPFGAAALDKSIVFGADGVVQCSSSFTTNAPGATTDPNCPGLYAPAFAHGALKPLDLSSDTPGYMPVFHSPAIDNVSCTVTPTPAFSYPAITDDMQETARPQGSLCDIGAIETDYIFPDGFD